jgi:hypothetical protein
VVIYAPSVLKFRKLGVSTVFGNYADYFPKQH